MSASKVRQNIRVAVRPLNSRELDAGESSVIYACKDTKITLKEKSSSRCYTFDRVFGPYSKQTDVYADMVHPTIIEVLEGYNCTIFAYGQTGTGKTFTMTGERSDFLRYTWENDPTAGIVPRALGQIFSTLVSMGCDFSVRVSFLELYNEELFDLLSVSEETVRLAVYDDANKKGSVIVKGLREVAVHDKDEVFGILEKGLQRRQTAATKLNDQSSRSHTVFTVTVHIKEVCPDNDEVFLRIGKLNLVDLAGSENIGRSGALEKRAREAGSINQSLLTLGRVITCLVDHAPHIPYRESKLTRLLQDSLGGKTKTSIIATISPSSACIEETLSTLDYAHRAKNIQNKPEINQRLNKNQLVKGYNEELERLRRDLEAARSKTGVYIDPENYQAMTLQLHQQRARIDDLEVRKEILQADLDSALRNFELTQHECVEIRKNKQKIEADLIRAQEELNLAVENLDHTRRRLVEEKYLRSKHQSTEEKLAQQAESLLSVASTYEMDLDGLREKISRFENLESLNHSAINGLSEVWLPDNLKEPIELIRTLKEDLSVDLDTLASALNEIRQQVLVSREKNVNALKQVSSNLALVMEENAKRCVDFVEVVLNDQVRAVSDFREVKLGPILRELVQVGVDLGAKLNSIREHLDLETKSQGQMLEALMQKVLSLSNSAGAWKRLFEIEMAENVKLRKELNARRDIEKFETRALVESVQEVLSRAASLAESRVEWDKKVDEGIAANCERIKQVADAEAKILMETSSGLMDSIRSANRRQTAAVSSIVDDVENCTAHIASLDCSVKRARNMLDAMVVDTTEVAKVCMTSTDGVGKELRDLSSQWRTLADSNDGIFDDLKSTDFFLRTLDDFKGGLLDTTKNTVALVAKANATIASAQVRVPVFEDLESTLVPRLPNLLSQHLAETIRGYETTGVTPTARSVSYSKVLTRTGRHSVLLSEFRQQQELSQSRDPFEDVTNVVPDSRAKFRFSNAEDMISKKLESGQNSETDEVDTEPGVSDGITF